MKHRPPKKCPICGEKLRLSNMIFMRIAKSRGMAIHLTREDPKEDVALCILSKTPRGDWTRIWMTDEEALSAGIGLVHASWVGKRP